MNLKPLIPKVACILLTVAIIAVDSRVEGASEEATVSEDQSSAVTAAQLQSHLMSFADRFVSILDTVIAQFESLDPQGTTRYEVLELITFSAHHAYLIAGASAPNVALLDMISMITMGRLFFEEEGQSRYGPIIDPVLKGFRKAEADIRNVAAQTLSPAQIDSLMTIIVNWRKNNPDVKSFPLLRFSNFAADRRESALTKADTPEGLFESVETASETVEEMRLLAERSVYMATRMPQLLGLFGDLWLTRWMNTPAVQTTLAEFATLSQGADRMADSLEKLPDQIAIERDATLKLFMEEISQERDLAIAQFIKGLAAEREAALDILLTEEKRIEALLLATASESMDRLERQGRELIEYLFYQLILLMLIGLVGYIAAALLIRLIFNKVAIFQKGD